MRKAGGGWPNQGKKKDRLGAGLTRNGLNGWLCSYV